ncbi:MAG: zinc metallopeptidase, partial [Anaerovoracaceae bacterium]
MYFGMFYDPTFMLLIPAIILSIYAQSKVNSTYRRFAGMRNRKGITGAEAARRILDANGLTGIPIEVSRGRLSDHYDPKNRVMRLSQDVFNQNSIASVSIAAHESGHAIQHLKNYTPLVVRNVIAVPVNVISMASWPLMILGIVIIQMGYRAGGNLIFDIGILAFVAVVLFHLITLPVELNASKRAMEELKKENIIFNEEAIGARKVLSAAALTYVAALAVAVAQLVRLLVI